MTTHFLVHVLASSVIHALVYILAWKLLGHSPVVFILVLLVAFVVLAFALTLLFRVLRRLL